MNAQESRHAEYRAVVVSAQKSRHAEYRAVVHRNPPGELRQPGDVSWNSLWLVWSFTRECGLRKSKGTSGRGSVRKKVLRCGVWWGMRCNR